MAAWLEPEGNLELFDLQQEFLDHVMRGAAERGLFGSTSQRMRAPAARGLTLNRALSRAATAE
jgi:hypothetical protein